MEHMEHTEEKEITATGVTKECKTCKLELTEDHFFHSGSSRKVVTKTCSTCRVKSNNYRYTGPYLSRLQTQRTTIAELRAHGCSFPGCLETRASTLEFDHRDPATKVLEVSSRKWMHRADFDVAFPAEVAKCDVLCSMHHRVKTFASVDKRSAHKVWTRPNQQRLYYRRKRFIMNYKLSKKGCELCNLPITTKTHRLFDLDHIEPANKVDHVSALWSKPMEIIVAELSKTRLLCVNCHRHHSLVTQ